MKIPKDRLLLEEFNEMMIRHDLTDEQQAEFLCRLLNCLFASVGANDKLVDYYLLSVKICHQEYISKYDR